ncbi:hypothetical protein CT19431_MP120004 [Cupriavidus taiwanensis]|nr:hypothetical protein CT19431_MP120004 [Cupriavidus taiwanensis]
MRQPSSQGRAAAAGPVYETLYCACGFIYCGRGWLLFCLHGAGVAPAPRPFKSELK